MKAKVIFSIVVVAVLSAGNNTSANNPQENDFHHIQLGVTFSPDYCYRILGYTPYPNSRDEMVEASFGYTGGFVVSFNPNKVYGIESGIQYSGKGYKEYEVNDCLPLCSVNNKWDRNIYRFHLWTFEYN